VAVDPVLFFPQPTMADTTPTVVDEGSERVLRKLVLRLAEATGDFQYFPT